MKIGLSTHALLNHRLTSIWLERIWNAGFPLVEIFCARQHFDYQNQAQVNELGHWFRDSELKLHSLHSPKFSDDAGGRSGPRSYVNIAEPVKSKRMEAVTEVKRALEVAEVIPFRYLVQHVGAVNDEFDETKMEAAFTSLEELRLFAGQRGVEILLENTHNELSTAERLHYFLNRTHLKMGYCFDTGHARLCGHVESEFNIMAEHIRSTHINDNDGVRDLHGYPFEEPGTIDWPATMKFLGARGDQFPLLLELKGSPDVEHPIERAKQTGDQLLSLVLPM
jgi:sugar phosphate isomerase/epimerase